MQASAPVEIDGSFGEGGGQILRLGVALAALTGREMRISGIRAGRAKGGLRPQHLAAVRAAAEMCGASVGGAAVGSKALVFRPGPLRAGRYAFDIGTGGAATLVLQTVLPIALRAGGPCTIEITGGTDVPMAPPADHTGRVLLPLLSRMGAEAACTIVRRGYAQSGGGFIAMETKPAPALGPLMLMERGAVNSIAGVVHSTGLPSHIPERIAAAAHAALKPRGFDATFSFESGTGAGTGVGVSLWADCAGSRLGAGLPGERGLRSEVVGERAGRELAEELVSGAALDVHAADQVLIYMALADGESAFTVRRVTTHCETAVAVISRFTGAVFSVEKADGNFLARCRPLKPG